MSAPATEDQKMKAISLLGYLSTVRESAAVAERLATVAGRECNRPELDVLAMARASDAAHGAECAAAAAELALSLMRGAVRHSERNTATRAADRVAVRFADRARAAAVEARAVIDERTAGLAAQAVQSGGVVWI